jgi:hypothetical protein
VKPETGTKPLALRPGEKYVGKQDGFTHPEVPTKVFKTVDNIDAECKPGGKVDTSGGNFKEKVGQLLKGGWKDPSFANDHPDWKDLFDHAPANPSTPDVRR